MCLEGVSRVSGRCLEGIYSMSEWYVRCLDVSEGQFRTSQVRTGQVRTGQDRCMESVWQVSGGCLKGVWRVYIGCPNGI